MKKRFSSLATALLCLPVLLLLPGCHNFDHLANGDSPYFGVSNNNKRWVPEELREDEKEEVYEDDYGSDY